MARLNKVYNGLLIFTIFCQILINSTNSQFQYWGLNKYQYFLWLCMFFLFVYCFFKYSLSRTVLMRLLILLIITIVLLLLKDYFFVQLFIFVIYSLYIDTKEIIKDYFYGIIFAVITVILLSYIGFFPMYTPGNYLLAFGFNNPNTLGLLITLIYLSGYLIFDKVNEIITLIVTMGIIYFTFFPLDDKTASITIFIFYILIHINVKGFNYFIKWITIIIPFVLFILAVFLSFYVEKYNWTLRLSSWLTGRPEIWAQYYSIYKVHLLPHDVQTFSLSNYERNFFGNNTPLLYRGFDGAYSSGLLTQGVIGIIILLIVISYYIYCLDVNKDRKLIIVFLSLLIFAFTESIFIVPFGSFTNYLLILAVRNVLGVLPESIKDNDSWKK